MLNFAIILKKSKNFWFLSKGFCCLHQNRVRKKKVFNVVETIHYMFNDLRALSLTRAHAQNVF